MTGTQTRLKKARWNTFRRRLAEERPDTPKTGPAAPNRHRHDPRRGRRVPVQVQVSSADRREAARRQLDVHPLALDLRRHLRMEARRRRDAALAGARARALLRVSRLRVARAPPRVRSAARRVYGRRRARRSRTRRLHRAGGAAHRTRPRRRLLRRRQADERPLLVRVRRPLGVLESLQHDSDAAVRRRAHHRRALAAAVDRRLRALRRFRAVLHIPILFVAIIGILGVPAMLAAWRGHVDPRAAR